MKEYIAETGGRYTYSDDILNLQELALSMTCIFEGCADFIISGCEISGNRVSEGYVWLGGKVRRFEGVQSATFPYFIYTINTTESVVYANESNKRGRINYLCTGGVATPEGVPFIEITQSYAPRVIDKFFGKYALLLDSPFSTQRINKELVLSGKLTGEKEIESKTSLSVNNPTNGYTLKNRVKADGSGAIALYLNGVLINELIVGTDGSFRFMKASIELAKIDKSGLYFSVARGTSISVGSVYIYNNRIINALDTTDQGAISINQCGYNEGVSKFRDFLVYDGKGVALLHVVGQGSNVVVNTLLTVKSSGKGVDIINTGYLKDNKSLTNVVRWRDSGHSDIGLVGFESSDNFDFIVRNRLGAVVLAPLSHVNILGELQVNGVNISSTYVSLTHFTEILTTKVDAVDGKQLSTENFTSELKAKLEGISSGGIIEDGDGFVTSSAIFKAMGTKLSIDQNLGDLADKGSARTNLDVYSRSESESHFLRISNKLQELVNLTAEEINSLTPEQASALKDEKQTAVRAVLNAERFGIGEQKLTKASNLSDLPDKSLARSNMSVYSTTEVDDLLRGKLGVDDSYTGVVFTSALKSKLDGIKHGNFAYTDAYGTSHAQVEGFVSTSQVLAELNKKANRLMDGYNSSDKGIVASNLGIYTCGVSDSRFAKIESFFQDYITYWVNRGKTTAEVQTMIRDKFDIFSKGEIINAYLRRDGKLTDLHLPNIEAKKLACRNLGAAYATDYQPKLQDTGWVQMSNSGSATDSRKLFIRQIGSIVSIQGAVNTGKRDGSNWGGTVAVIPNSVQPPKYDLHVSHTSYNNDHKYNRGVSFTIVGNSRKVEIYESGWSGVDVSLNFTYMI